MKNENKNTLFNHGAAITYDNQREKLAPIKEALHFCIRMILSKLPSDAKILCVGVGTGSELIWLAEAFPQWQFTVVEPAAAMLDVCRQNAEDCGISSRCTFHEGYLDSLSDSNLFNAATSILVSHFIVDSVARRQYFTEISSRLFPGAYMINADLSGNMSAESYHKLIEVWVNMHEYANFPVKIESFGRNVAMSTHDEIESIIKSSGFETPVLFFQTFLIHAWFSIVSSDKLP